MLKDAMEKHESFYHTFLSGIWSGFATTWFRVIILMGKDYMWSGNESPMYNVRFY